MISVPSTEFAKNFGRYQSEGQREPVEVTSHNRVVGYFLSEQEFKVLMRFKSHLPKAIRAEDLSDQALIAIAGAKMDPEHDGLNALLDDQAPG